MNAKVSLINLYLLCLSLKKNVMLIDSVFLQVIRDSSGRSTPVFTTKYVSDSDGK